MGKEELISKMTTECWEYPSPCYLSWAFVCLFCFSCRGLPPGSGLLERGNFNQAGNKRRGEKAGEMSPSLGSSCRHPGTAVRRGKKRRGELSEEGGYGEVPCAEGSFPWLVHLGHTESWQDRAKGVNPNPAENNPAI